MKIEGREEVAAPRAVVWRLLDDPAVLRACTPGLEKLEETAPGHFDAELALALPMLKGRFTGSVDHVERAEPERMRLRLAGKGAPGFVNGEATLVLAEAGPGTEVRYEADVTVGGQIARLGQRMISAAAKEMAGQFFEAFDGHAKAAASAATPASGAASPVAGAGTAAVAPAPLPVPPPVSPLRAFLQLVFRTIRNLLGLSRRS